MNRSKTLRASLRNPLHTAGFVAALALTAPAAQGPQDELKELFQRVELQMQRIDELLNNAAAGNTGSLSEVGPSEIDKLLKATEKQGQEVIEDINRILEIAESQGGSSSSSSSSSQSQSGQSSGEQSQGQSPSPLDRGQQTSSRESTPEAPAPSGEPQGEQPQGEQPGEQPGEESGGDEQQQPQDGQGDPNSPLDSNDPNPANQAAEDPQAGPTAPPPGTVRDADRWGALPLQTRRTFRAEGDGDVPPAYRDWIDAYYRRLNREDR